MSRGKRWSEEELNYIKANYDIKSPRLIANKLNRNQESVRVILKRLNLSAYSVSNADYITISQLSKMINVTEKTINNWINTYDDFPIVNKVYYSYVHKLIVFYKLLPWLKNHQDLFNTLHMDKYIFGEEPDWLIAKRNHDKLNMAKNYKLRYTKEECRIIMTMYKRGKSYKEIATTLNRSPTAIKKKILALKQN